MPISRFCTTILLATVPLIAHADQTTQARALIFCQLRGSKTDE